MHDFGACQTIELEPTNQGLAHVTYGLRAPTDEGVFLEIYPGWSPEPEGMRIPLSVGDVVTFEVTHKTNGGPLDRGVSVEGVKGSGRSTVSNPRLRVGIAGSEIATVGAGTGGRLSQFFALAELDDGQLAAFTHTTVTSPHADGTGRVGRAHHWGAPYLAFSEPLTIEVLGPGLVDTPALVEDEQ